MREKDTEPVPGRTTEAEQVCGQQSDRSAIPDGPVPSAHQNRPEGHGSQGGKPTISPAIPDYELLRPIGRGAFGEVWLARNRHDGQLCAVKIFPKTRAAELEGVREYRKRAAGNPFLAPIHHVGESGEFYYYVMPLADDAKQSTTHWLPENYEPLTLWRYLLWQGRLPLAEVLEIASCVLKGLERLHAAGGVHCDVKPGNVLRFEGVWKLGDPGLIRPREKLGATQGTFRFWPPEGTVDQTADLYALGKTMYLLLAGAKAELPERIEQASLPIGLERGSPIWRIIERACASDPAIRYRSAGEMRRDVEGLLGRLEKRPRRGRRTMLLAAPVVALGLVFAALWGPWLWEPDPGGIQEQHSSVPSPSSEAVQENAPVQPATGSQLGVENRSAPLEGDVTILVWNERDSTRRALRIDDPGVLPLRDGDRIRMVASFSRPAYPYLVWISSDGVAEPIYPWQPGDWTSFPEQERAIGRLTLPAGMDEAWPVTGPPGMDTVVLLACSKPASRARDLRDLLGGLPAQPLRKVGSLLVRLNGTTVGSAERGLDFSRPERLDDPLLRFQRQLADQLAERFELVRIVSFANTVGAPGQKR